MRHNPVHLFRSILPVVRDELHKHPHIKFFFVFLILFGYTILTSIKFGMRDGLLLSVLTWSFFVLCTPIADAGFLLDFPLRIFTGIRMLYSEGLVWLLAICLNVIVSLIHPEVYQETVLLSLFAHILVQPWPYWGIILLSGIGSFLSVIFGDEIIDVGLNKKQKREHHKAHKIKHHFILILFFIILVLILYDYLLYNLGVAVPWF